MAYVLQSALKGKVPDTLLLQALDDDADGVADDGVWDKISADVDLAIDSRLEGRYTVPISDPLPSVIVEAAIVFAAEAVYLRRGLSGDQNPWSGMAKSMRKRLDRIGRGDEPLKNNVTPDRSGGTVISETARTYDESGRLMV